MERTRTTSWQDPGILAKEGSQLSGLEFLEGMAEGKISRAPILETLDIQVHHIEKGEISFYFIPQEFHYNPIGTVHGGVITAILDSAIGCSVHSLLPKGKGYTTLEIKVNFLRPVTSETGKLVATGKIIHAGSRTALAEAQLTDASGKIFAHAVSTCLILG